MHVAKFWQLTNLNPYIIITYTDKHIEMQKWRNWQTRTVQVRMVAILCGFKSHLLQVLRSLLRLLFYFPRRLKLFSDVTSKYEFPYFVKKPTPSKEDAGQKEFLIYYYINIEELLFVTAVTEVEVCVLIVLKAF